MGNIYVFPCHGNIASVVYDGSTLSDAQKSKAVVVQSLPEAEVIPGKVAVLRADKATERVWYDYIDIPPSAVEKDIEMIKGVLDELLLGGAL